MRFMMMATVTTVSYTHLNETVLSAVRIFDNSKGDDFEKFLKGCLSRKFKTLMTRRNRNKRFADRMCVSLDTPIRCV